MLSSANLVLQVGDAERISSLHVGSSRLSKQSMQKTVKLRLRDKHAVDLNRQARAVNFVWNYCNGGQRHAFDTRWAWKDKWLSYKALASLTAGTAEDLVLHSHTSGFVAST